MEIVRYTQAERTDNQALLDELTALEALCFSDPWSRGMMKGMLDNENMQLFLLRENGNVIAYLMLFVVLPEGEILNLAVAPDYRRRGLADKLFEATSGYCREIGVEMLFLEVRASNTPAISLYEKQGFVAVGRRKNYYRYPREDAIVMLWHIDTQNPSL